MKSNFDILRLKELLKDFYAVIGIRISIFDDEFCRVAEYPENPPAFCATIRKKPSGLEDCMKCDRAAFIRASKGGEAHTYLCHAGLTETITPIQLDNHVVGYAIFAHMMPEENYQASIANIRSRSRHYFDSDEQMLDAIHALPTLPHATICASARLLEAIASFLQIQKLTSWSNYDIAHQLDKFIRHNLSEDLSSKTLCRHFLISRTKLYQISLENFGTGITQYIKSLRIEKAAELLKENNDRVKSIAEKVGIGDYNYFCKLFKQTKGISPNKFRNS